jgi:hypothetical protein
MCLKENTMPVIEVIDKTTKDNFLIKYVGLMKALIKKSNPRTIKIIRWVTHKGHGSRLNFFWIKTAKATKK